MPSSCAMRMYSVCIEGGELTDAIRSLNGAWGTAGVIRLRRRHSAAGTVAYFDISFLLRSLQFGEAIPMKRSIPRDPDDMAFCPPDLSLCHPPGRDPNFYSVD